MRSLSVAVGLASMLCWGVLGFPLQEETGLVAEAWRILEDGAGRFPDEAYVAMALRSLPLPGERYCRLVRRIGEGGRIPAAKVEALYAAVGKGDCSDFEFLNRTFHSGNDPLVRGTVVSVIGEAEMTEGIPLIREFLETTPFQFTGPAYGALVRLGDPAIAPALEFLRSGKPEIRPRAVWILGRIEGFRDLALLRELAEHDPSEEMRKESLLALVEKRDVSTAPLLEDRLARASDPETRLEMAAALVRLGEAEHFREIEQALQDSREAVRYLAVWKLIEIGGPEAEKYLRTSLRDRSAMVRVAAQVEVARFATAFEPELIRSGLEDPDPFVVAAWLETAGRLDLSIDIEAPLRLVLAADEGPVPVSDFLKGCGPQHCQLLGEALFQEMGLTHRSEFLPRLADVLSKQGCRQSLPVLKEAFMSPAITVSAAGAKAIDGLMDPQESVRFFQPFLGEAREQRYVAAAALLKVLLTPTAGPAAPNDPGPARVPVDGGSGRGKSPATDVPQ